MTKIVLDFHFDEAKKLLQTMAARGHNMRPITAAIAAIMDRAVHDNFQKNGRPTPWTPIKPSTNAARKRGRGNGKILYDTGGLQASIMPGSDGGTAWVGTNKPYAAWQQFGTRPHVIRAKNKQALKFGGIIRRKVNHPGTPPRPFMVLPNQDRELIADEIIRYFTGR